MSADGGLNRDLLLEGLRRSVAARKVRSEAALEEFVTELREVFGGPSGMAKALYREFSDAPPGSNTRAQYLKMMLQLHKDEKKSGAAADEADLTDDELADATLPAYLDGLERGEG